MIKKIYDTLLNNNIKPPLSDEDMKLNNSIYETPHSNSLPSFGNTLGNIMSQRHEVHRGDFNKNIETKMFIEEPLNHHYRQTHEIPNKLGMFSHFDVKPLGNFDTSHFAIKPPLSNTDMVLNNSIYETSNTHSNNIPSFGHTIENIMSHGHEVHKGDFSKNIETKMFIEEPFNHHYRQTHEIPNKLGIFPHFDEKPNLSYVETLDYFLIKPPLSDDEMALNNSTFEAPHEEIPSFGNTLGNIISNDHEIFEGTFSKIFETQETLNTLKMSLYFDEKAELEDLETSLNFDNFEIKPPLNDLALSFNELIYETANNDILDVDFNASFGDTINNIIDTSSKTLSNNIHEVEVPVEYSSFGSSLSDQLSLFEINIDNI